MAVAAPGRTFHAPATLDEALRLLAELGPRAGVVAGGTDLVVAARGGRKPLPEAIVAIDRLPGLDGHRGDGGRRPGLGALVTHARSRALEPDPRAAGRPCPMLRRSSARPRPAMSGRSAATWQRVAGDGDRVAAPRVRRRGGAPLGRRIADRPVGSSSGPGPHDRGARRADHRRPCAGAGRAGRAARTCGSSTGGDGDRGRGSGRARGARRRRTLTEARVAITAVAPTVVRSAAAEAALRGNAPTAEVIAAAAAAAARRGRHRSTTSRVGRLPVGDDRGDRTPRAGRRRAGARPAMTCLCPQRWRWEAPDESRLHAQGERHVLPPRARRRTDAPHGAPGRARADRRQGGLRRLRVRSLHGAGRRPAGELVLLPGAPGRRPRHHYGRGARERRRAAPAPAAFLGRAASSAASAPQGC